MSQSINDKGQKLVDAAGRLQAGDQNLASSQRNKVADTPPQLASDTTKVNGESENNTGIVGKVDNVMNVAGKIGDALEAIPGIGSAIGGVVNGVKSAWNLGKEVVSGIKNLFNK